MVNFNGKRLIHQRGQATIEFMALIVFVMGAFLFFQKYIAQGFNGRWVRTGDTMGSGRLYDPKKTLECAYSEDYDTWYSVSCYEQNHCDCFSIRVTCGSSDCNQNKNNDCQQCINNCSVQKCIPPT